MDFSSFKLTECGTSAQTRVAEGRRTENGVHVEYYISTRIWDNGSRGYHEFRRIVRAFDGLSSGKLTDVKLKEFVGHTPIQVLAGILLGIVNAVLLHLFIFP